MNRPAAVLFRNQPALSLKLRLAALALRSTESKGRGRLAVRAIVNTQDLTKSLAGHRAVAGVSLSIEAGSIHAITGPNDAGKTTR